MTNYCGPYFFPEWLKKLLSFGINDACKLHDHYYTVKDLPRFLTDLIFMYHIIWCSILNILKGVYGLVAAPFFFVLIVMFGKRSWNYGNEDQL